jgi:hypothetical protein
MLDQIDRDFAGDDDAKAGIGAAVRYLLKDAAVSARGDRAFATSRTDCSRIRIAR